MSTASHLGWSLALSPPIRRPGADVPSFEELHLQPAVAATLDQLGWQPDNPLAKDATPTAARGHNLVVVTPPAPAYSAPVVGAILSRLTEGTRGLLLVPAPQLDEWGGLAHRLARSTAARVHVARGTARSLRLLRADALDVLVTTPEVALGLVTRSGLAMEKVGSLLLAWPEMLLDEDAVTPLMQDLPREAQRIVYTSEAERVESLVERYARKALVVGSGSGTPSSEPVRTVATSWSGRIRTVTELIELLDPASLVVWTADRQYHEAIAQLTANQPGLQLTTGDALPASAVIAFDLPTSERLRQLLTAGPVVLLVPPGTESYVALIATHRRPVVLTGPVDELRAAEAARRSAIVQALQTMGSTSALLTLAPLFERHDPTAVAAALYQLWLQSERAATPTPQPPPQTQTQTQTQTAKVYVGLGKKDGANPNELVAVLTKELRVDRGKIGRIELRDSYSLIELPAQEAEQVAAALNGLTIRKKRVSARVDRGPTRPGRDDGVRSGRPPRRAERG
jgi:ATP-dependent RNA helicase DeaD